MMFSYSQGPPLASCFPLSLYNVVFFGNHVVHFNQNVQKSEVLIHNINA